MLLKYRPRLGKRLLPIWIRRRKEKGLTFSYPKPKENKSHMSKDDSTSLYAKKAQKLQDEEEEGEDAGCELGPQRGEALILQK